MPFIAESTESLQISTILIGLFGGLAIFLFGMEQMTDALKIVAGERMKNLLAKLTTNRFTGAFAGAIVTAIIQSSSVTTVLLVGFISAGLMTLPQSIGVIMGANIGTTITAQIIAFKVTKYALVLVTIGFMMQFTSKRQKIRQYGLMLMGLGLIFFGMDLMSNATKPLRSYQPFIDLMQQMTNPILAILIAAVFTAIIQSSSATTGVIIALATQGFITLEAGIALAFGANLGTCVTALLAAIGKPREAVQAAVAHVIFNILGVVVWFGFIDQLTSFVQTISPVAAGLEGTDKLAAETPRQIANAHTLFNVTNTFLFIWFTGPLASLVQRLIPAQPQTEPELIKAKYLDNLLLDTPELALERVRRELGRLGVYTLRMVEKVLPAVFHGNQEELEALAKMDDNVDTLHESILSYLGQLSQANLLESQSQQLSNYMAVANHIENIGDMIETNLVQTGRQRLQHDLRMSEATIEILKALHDQVFWAVEASLEAMVGEMPHLAEEVMAAKVEINRLADEANNHLVQRLIAEEPNRLLAFRIESEMIEYFKRVYYFAKRIAKVATDTHLVYKQVDLRQTAQEVT